MCGALFLNRDTAIVNSTREKQLNSYRSLHLRCIVLCFVTADVFGGRKHQKKRIRMGRRMSRWYSEMCKLKWRYDRDNKICQSHHLIYRGDERLSFPRNRHPTLACKERRRLTRPNASFIDCWMLFAFHWRWQRCRFTKAGLLLIDVFRPSLRAQVIDTLGVQQRYNVDSKIGGFLVGRGRCRQ